MSIDREFHHEVVRVEERFRTVYDTESLGSAKSETQVKTDQVSTGWWVALKDWPVAMRFGASKPDIEPGDTLVLIARRIPKMKPDAQAPAPAAPVAPPPIPAGVYFSIDADNFYDIAANKGRGNDFFKEWKPRWREFPAAPPIVVARGTPEEVQQP